jgi:corrinoid protein of di/trimethylamine methyltransferase
MATELYDKVSTAVTNGEEGDAQKLVAEALAAGLPPADVLQKGVVAGITKAGELWKANEFFLPDVILAADAFKAAMGVLEPKLKAAGNGRKGRTYVIGVVAGDMHDLGKSLVVAMLQSAGFDVVDLGIDVPREKFIQAVKQHSPAVLGMGAYMTTTMLEMKAVISDLEAQGLRKGLKVMVGGVPTSQEFAREVGADAWGKDALDTMKKALEMVEG